MYTVCKFQFNCFSRLAAAVRKYEQAASLPPAPPPLPVRLRINVILDLGKKNHILDYR